jgi:hypothetical protein
MILPPDAKPVFDLLVPIFTHPTATRFANLIAGALLTTGRRTIANILRTLGHLAKGHRTSFQRVLSSAQWSGLALGCALTRLLLERFLPQGPITLVGDDTVDGHPGRKVYGKARHRDAVRSSHSYTAWRYGHKWVVLAVLVRVPWATRPWALPVLIDLYRSPEVNQAEGRRHRTPAQLMMRLLRVLLRRFPTRSFVFVGDSGFGSHEVARFCHRHQPRLTRVSKFPSDARVFKPPPPYRGCGRPRVKGAALPKPRDVAATAKRHRRKVPWYGGGTRKVDTVTAKGHWYKAGQGLVPIRWVFVSDQSGTHRDEYLYTTATTFSDVEVITAYCGRWNIETTFQECRSCLGLETTCGWSRRTVLRAGPCLLGLYGVVALLFDGLPPSKRKGSVTWPGKQGVTFTDALTSVRQWLWTEGVFPESKADTAINKLPRAVKTLLIQALATAA